MHRLAEEDALSQQDTFRNENWLVPMERGDHLIEGNDYGVGWPPRSGLLC